MRWWAYRKNLRLTGRQFDVMTKMIASGPALQGADDVGGLFRRYEPPAVELPWPQRAYIGQEPSGSSLDTPGIPGCARCSLTVET